MYRLLALLGMMVVSSAALGQKVADDAARVSWVPPTARTDETPLPPEEIDGYRVYWGETEATVTENSVGTTETTYTVTGLAPGTWYFAVRAIDTNGLVSDLSTIATKTILSTAPPQPPRNIEIE